MIKAICAALVLALVQVSGSVVLASPQSMSLPNCAGTPQVTPASVTLTCADAGISASRLQWTGWGQTFAAAQGTMSINDCKPYCAAGHFHSYRVILIASGKQRCPNGSPAYKTVTYAFIGSNAPKIADPTAQFPCGPRR